MTPSHRALPVGGNALENLVGMASEVMTDRNHRTVHKTDTRTASEGMEFQEEHQLEEYTAFKFYKPVIGYRIRKFPMQVYSDIMQVVMFEVGERTEMEYNQDGHNLTVGKRCLAMPAANASRGYEFTFGHLRIKFLAEFI